MKRTITLILLAVALSGISCKAAEAITAEAAFGADCEKLLLKEIRKAKKQVQVAIFSFTRQSIRNALVDAAKRDVKVHVKYDAESAEWAGMSRLIGYLKKRGVECTAIKLAKVGKTSPKMHHKFVVIDGKCVLTGSFNFSYTASTKSYENLVLISDASIAKRFIAEFNIIKSK